MTPAAPPELPQPRKENRAVGAYDELKAQEAAKPKGKRKGTKQKKGDKVQTTLQKAIKELELAKQAVAQKESDWEEEKNACRGKLAMIFKHFEQIVAEDEITKQGNNRELFRRVLNLRV